MEHRGNSSNGPNDERKVRVSKLLTQATSEALTGKVNRFRP